MLKDIEQLNKITEIIFFLQNVRTLLVIVLDGINLNPVDNFQGCLNDQANIA